MFSKTAIVITESGPIQGFKKTAQDSELTIDCFSGFPMLRLQ